MFQCTNAHMGQSAIDRPGGQSGGSMCMVQHMATTLIGGRARACGWKGANQMLHISKRGQSTYVFAIRARYRLVLYWFAHCICAHVRMQGANQMHKLHAGPNQNARNPSQNCAWKWFGRIFWGFLEKINTTCTRWYRCQTIWNRNNKKPQNSN